MKTTRCKFKCNSVTDYGQSQSIDLSPVTGGSDENKDFWKWTPAGSFKIDCVNPEVKFVPNKEYYIDISETE